MSHRVEEVTAWVYRGIWGVLTRWFRVPSEPPSLPVGAAVQVRSFRPSEGFLRYLKFKFWIALVIIDLLILGGWIALVVAFPVIGLWLAPVAFAIAVLPDIIAYVAIHLRYDTTWYVFSDRSLRIRRGIWVIHETTITFENIQNVSVNSGPLERFFGISNVTVDTAGGGQPAGKNSEGGKSVMNYHQGMIEGIENVNEIRTLVLDRVRHSRSAGLGDEAAGSAGWSAAHVAVLREIRDGLLGG
jgi:membrane protein YdbS with pleckstrin-like domain